MRLENNEYSISENNSTITINKETLIKWRNHYNNVSSEEFDKEEDRRAIYYMGKAEILADILKHFPEDDVN